MIQHKSVEQYLESIKDFKEQLSNPNEGLSKTEIRLGKGKDKKVLSKTENSHEKILLGDHYKDKEFLR